MVRRTSLAHCRVKYRTEAGLEETIWNTLADEPPQGVEERTTGEIANLVEDQPRDYRPKYVPELGERIFVRMDEPARRRRAEFIVDDPKMPADVSELFTTVFKTRDEAIEYLTNQLAEGRAIDTVYVTSAIRDQIKAQHASSDLGGRELDREGADSVLAVLFTTATIDPQLRAELRRMLESFDYSDRDGKRISMKEYAALQRDEKYATLADTHIADGFHVKTEWTGLDSDNHTPPHTFRTLFVRRKNVGECDMTESVMRTYASEADAFRGHAMFVNRAREAVQDQLD